MWLQRTNDRHRSLGEGRGRGDGHTTSIYTCLPNATVMRENTCVRAEVTWWMTGVDGQVDKVTGWNERWGFGYRWSVPLVLPQRRGERRRGQLALKKGRQMKAIAAPTTHCTPVCVHVGICVVKCPSVCFEVHLLGLLQGRRLIAHLSFCQLRALQHMVRLRRSHTGGWVGDTRRRMHRFDISHEPSRESLSRFITVCVLQWVTVCVTACRCVFNFYMQRDWFLNPLQCHDRLKCLTLFHAFSGDDNSIDSIMSLR